MRQDGSSRQGTAGAEKDVPQPLPRAGSKIGDELMHTAARWHKRLIQSVPKPVGMAGLWIWPQQDTKRTGSSIAAVAIGLKAFLAAPALGQGLLLFPHPAPGHKHTGIC